MLPEMRLVCYCWLDEMVILDITALVMHSSSLSACGCFEGAGGDQPASEAVHGQNHFGHSRPQSFHPGDQELNTMHICISEAVLIYRYL